MKEKTVKSIDSSLFNFLVENISVMVECDLEEKPSAFPYTIACSNFVRDLKHNHNKEFDEELFGEKLIGFMVDEITAQLPK
ncbi:MAG: hypothetical protein Q4G04_01480 [bacterium]|nr:hypothetical protein [bacterium]